MLTSQMPKRARILAACALSFSAQPVVEAQQRIDTPAGEPIARGNSASPEVEEVVVTAQKRVERLKDVPISIEVLSGDTLDSARTSGLLETLTAAPSVTMRESAQGSTTALAIRGVTANQPHFQGSSPIGFYLDSLPFGLVRSAAVPDVNPFDLDRVEILRGPQGTLYGASSLNGVVRVLTREPDLDEFAFKARTSASLTKKGGDNYRGDAALNVPLLESKLAARVVVGHEERSGWVDTPNREDVNDARVNNLRLKLKAEPTEALSIGLTLWRSRTDLGAASISDDQDRRSSDAVEFNDTGFDTYGFSVNYQLPSFTISSMTSYLEFHNESVLSLDALAAGLPFFDTSWQAKTFSQELLLSSNTGGAWRWSAGAFYRDAEESLFQVLSGNDATDSSESIAFFGQVSRMLMDDRLEASLGLRYFEDEVSYRDHPDRLGLAPYSVTDKFDNVSPKATLTWHVDTDTTIYASYSEGFRSGFSQFSTVGRVAPELPPMGPDELTNYEIGTKASFAGRRVDLEAAVFFIDWRNTQQIINVQDDDSVAVFPAGVNVGKIDGLGVDFALKARPVAGLELGISYSWNDLAFGSSIESAGQVIFAEGMRPTSSAEETLGGSLLYSHMLGGGWAGSFETSANYTSRITDVSMVNGVANVQSGEPILQVRSALSLEAPEHWTITAFVENLTNTRHFPSRNFQTPEWTTRLRPRTYGLQLEYAF